MAGLKTSTACVRLLDVVQISTKILPQACLLLLDKAFEVRTHALLLVDACMEIMRENHAAMGRAGDSKTDLAHTGTSSSSGTAAESAAQTDGGWSSWSVLQGLSKTLETATIATNQTASPAITKQPAIAAPLSSPPGSSKLTSNHSSFDINDKSNGGKARFAPETKGGSLDRLSSRGDTNDALAHNRQQQQRQQDSDHSEEVRSSQWDEADAIRFDDDDDEEQPFSPVRPSEPSRSIAGMSLSAKKESATGAAAEPASGSAKVARVGAKAKVAVKKLDVNKEDASWDDF